jgi:hypothetical protein
MPSVGENLKYGCLESDLEAMLVVTTADIVLPLATHSKYEELRVMKPSSETELID